MIRHESIWRLRLWVWVPALLFFLANAAAFTVYRLGYAGDVQSLKRELEKEKKELRTQEADRRKREALLASAKDNRDRIQLLYEQRFSTRRQRLTGVTAEVRKLASQAGLEPPSVSFPENPIEAYGLVKRSFIFTVQGTYPELRRFINLLETSNSFLILEEVGLNHGADKSGDDLRISLKLSTLFRDETATTVVPPVQRARAGGGVS
jgi:type IV pilus assembly protein PilO